MWKAQSYRLLSLGADGEPGGGDLCVSGRTRFAALADAALVLSKLPHGQNVTWSARLEALRAPTAPRPDGRQSRSYTRT